ncbi:hypothetical protein WMY93_021556 [Mugilogobius chulae]|uniref:Coiled coil protein 74 C-terminal domain-containing protein n=1 Tax=Mugilogobius chulae TaxID=88201 RepID=A0AAW0NNG8_9GOBI
MDIKTFYGSKNEHGSEVPSDSEDSELEDESDSGEEWLPESGLTLSVGGHRAAGEAAAAAGGGGPRRPGPPRRLSAEKRALPPAAAPGHAGQAPQEIEHLRRENKELQYKLIMDSPTVSGKGLPTSRRGIRPPTQGSDARTGGLYLEEQLQDTRPLHQQQTGNDAHLQTTHQQTTPRHPPRPPTLHECEVIIRQLYNANSIQSQELIRVKALLRDIVFSKKITPENYILTKTYLADGTRRFSETEKLPKLGLQTFPEKTSEAVPSPLILPALKQSFSSSIADRQRRTRAVQRSRFKRVVQVHKQRETTRLAGPGQANPGEEGGAEVQASVVRPTSLEQQRSETVTLPERGVGQGTE